MAVFSDRLKELRKTKGVTQKQVAEYLGITERQYQRYEYGRYESNHDTTIKLADFFGVSTDYLLGRTDHWHDAEGNITVKAPSESVTDAFTGKK